ncbi:hypothetical protein VNO77_14036 [Canavalia gladiata]|uniref:Uncharacterized protein n=1 Tax=Canavalia gladiata TaxID=3824 RepID=A0AAN9M309_CANGL
MYVCVFGDSVEILWFGQSIVECELCSLDGPRISPQPKLTLPAWASLMDYHAQIRESSSYLSFKSLKINKAKKQLSLDPGPWIHQPRTRWGNKGQEANRITAT